MKKFKDLTRDEKIRIALGYRPIKAYNGRMVKARYLWALRNNRKKTIEYFESMGDDFRHIMENVRAFERAKECGFTEPQFNEYGWCMFRLKIVREIPVHKSCVIIGKTPSGKFVYAVEHNTGTGGGGWWPGIWDELHDTENEAIMAGYEYLKKRLERDIYRDEKKVIINATLREIERLKRPVQLELF